MSTKKVNLIINLKSNALAGLKKIGGGLKTLGTGFKNLAKIGVASFALVTAGIIALGKAFAEQETSNNKMKAAFDAVGESGADAVKKWGAWATAIQRTTTLGDEQIMDLITLGKVMGVSNDQLEKATKGAIGLSKAFGIDLQASMKMVALANQGEFDMLARYIPALRKATTETEKADIVNRAMANGFKIAEAELNTLAGQWESFKGVVGDAMQEAGKAVGEGGFTDLIKNLKESIIELTESGAITQWASKVAAGFKSIMAQAQQAADTIRKLKMRSEIRSEVEAAVFGEQAPGVGGAIAHRRQKTPENRAKVEEFTTRIMRKRLAEEAQKRQLILNKEGMDRKEQILKEAELAKQKLFENAKAAADKNKGLGAEVAKEVADIQVEELKTKLEEAAPEIAKSIGSAISPVVPGGGATPGTGFAQLSAKFSGQGVTGIDLKRRNAAVATAERRGLEAGVTGQGSIAGDLASQGLTGIDLSRAIAESLKAELSGREEAEIEVGKQIMKTNDLLQEQTKLQKDRLGGVLN